MKITTVILTYNSTSSIEKVIDSCKSISDHILVVDSFSTDNTLEILKRHRCKIVQHSFDNYSAQRNWAQSQLQLDPDDWILHLDSDEVLSNELVESIRHTKSNPNPQINGYLIQRLSFFMGKPIRFGHINPSWHLRLFKAGEGQCEDRLYDQHFIVNGLTCKIKGLLLDLQETTVETWTNSHNRWSSLEALEIAGCETRDCSTSDILKASLSGDPRMQKRWLKNNIYYRSPLFLRAILFFLYSYFLRLGFLDGKTGFVYHVLQSFWFRFLVDAKIIEYRSKT